MHQDLLHIYFQVIAQTGNELVFWVSEPDSGFSVDNLAPAMPVGIIGTPDYYPPAITIEWEPNTEPDLAFYRIYRGDEPGFVPGEATLIATTGETSVFDDNEMWAASTYKICAVDIHGNESECAILWSSNVTDDANRQVVTRVNLYVAS